MMTNDSELFLLTNGIFVRRAGVRHRNEEYHEHFLEVLIKMQTEHFWYRGRARFLRRALEDQLRRRGRPPETLRAIDLGAGCGGWIKQLAGIPSLRFKELAVGDSSLTALQYAGTVAGPTVSRFQTDLLDLGWENRWDVVFLLDVLEHIPDDVEVLRQVRQALVPGGLLFLASPALNAFWSYNDDLAGHQRRYSAGDLDTLGRQTGLTLCAVRYFFFFLSPLLYLSRLFGPGAQDLSPEQAREKLARTHAVPPRPLNALLYAIFALETPLGLRLPFPWGTSILGVFQK